MVRAIPIRGKLFVGGEFSNHKETSPNIFDSIHREFDFGLKKKCR